MDQSTVCGETGSVGRCREKINFINKRIEKRAVLSPDNWLTRQLLCVKFRE